MMEGVIERLKQPSTSVSTKTLKNTLGILKLIPSLSEMAFTEELFAPDTEEELLGKKRRREVEEDSSLEEVVASRKKVW